jgi:hypothetical protein
LGYQALTGFTTGNYNVVLGEGAGKLITTGGGNVLIGRHCGDELVSGEDNTMMGYAAGHRTTGNRNVLIGYLAGDNLTTGANNTGVGTNVAFDVDADNQTAIGNGATTDSANDIAIGNTSVDEVKGQVDFTTFSDRRIKRDIEDNDLGLDFINDLRPRKFKKVNPAKYPDSIRKQNDGRDSEGNEYEWTDAQANKVWDGLIAQEVKEAVDKAGTSYSGWNIEKNSKESVTYSTLVTPLIKAVQELSKKVETLQEENIELKTLIKEKLGD